MMETDDKQINQTVEEVRADLIYMAKEWNTLPNRLPCVSVGPSSSLFSEQVRDKRCLPPSSVRGDTMSYRKVF